MRAPSAPVCVLPADLRMSHGDDVAIALHASDCVLECLSFGHGRVGGVRDGDHLAAESKHGRLEAGCSARGRLVEQSSEDATTSQLADTRTGNHGGHPIRDAHQTIDLGAAQLAHTQQVSTAEVTNGDGAGSSGRQTDHRSVAILLHAFARLRNRAECRGGLRRSGQIGRVDRGGSGCGRHRVACAGVEIRIHAGKCA